MIYSIKHDSHNRIYIVRRCCLFDIFDTQFLGNG